MADSRISDLTTATTVGSNDLLVLEQNSTAKKLSGQTLVTQLLNALDGHGGISSVTWTTSGTSGDGQYHNGTFHYADGTSSTIQIRDGLKGNTGDADNVYIKYAATRPTSDSDLSDTPDRWIGICAQTTEPTSFSDYDWFDWKGDTGEASEVTDSSVLYQVGDIDGNMPTGVWVPLSEISNLDGGKYLWSKTTVTFNETTEVITYAKSRQGVDGTGVAGTAVPLPDSGDGAVGTSVAFAREDHVHPVTVTDLTVGTAASNNIQVNSSVVTTLNRYYAKRIGNLCIFSFVASNADAFSSSSYLFSVASGYRPSSQVDFVLFSSMDGAKAGALTTSGLINSFQTISGNGSVRAEIVWVIE